MKIDKNTPLAPFTTFNVGGRADYFCIARSYADIEKAVAFAKEKGIPILPLGEGSNILVSDEGFRGLVMKVELYGVETRERADEIEVVAGAGEVWDDLVALCVEKGFFGLENLSGIPGTVGAAPIQNIGAYGKEVSSCVAWVEVIDMTDGKTRTLTGDECEFGYRDSIFKREKGKNFFVARVAFRLSKEPVVDLSYRDVREFFDAQRVKNPTPREVRMAVLEIRSRKFPDLELVGTAGSFFKNPVIDKAHFESLQKKYPDIKGFSTPSGEVKVSLAWVIEHVCHMKSARVGDAGLAPNQSLVVCNFGNATARDIRMLAEKIVTSVKEKTNIDIVPEVRHV